ncbi:unnamed protein product [Lasius platythorax]|uniref:Uncharacterized protein n=1 Tax=Lasius platythorax TaxID=488582 RepID=A0AAV2NHQ3_9HYME
MANSSYSSSINSFNEPFTKEQEMTLYNSINMNLEAIRKATHDINVQFKGVQKEMRVTNALINAIETKSPTLNAD